MALNHFVKKVLFDLNQSAFDHQLVATAAALIQYGIKNAESFSSISSVKADFREALVRYGATPSMCDLIFDLYVSKPNSRFAFSGVQFPDVQLDSDMIDHFLNEQLLTWNNLLIVLAFATFGTAVALVACSVGISNYDTVSYLSFFACLVTSFVALLMHLGSSLGYFRVTKNKIALLHLVVVLLPMFSWWITTNCQQSVFIRHKLEWVEDGQMIKICSPDSFYDCKVRVPIERTISSCSRLSDSIAEILLCIFTSILALITCVCTWKATESRENTDYLLLESETKGYWTRKVMSLVSSLVVLGFAISFAVLILLSIGSWRDTGNFWFTNQTRLKRIPGEIFIPTVVSACLSLLFYIFAAVLSVLQFGEWRTDISNRSIVYMYTLGALFASLAWGVWGSQESPYAKIIK